MGASGQQHEYHSHIAWTGNRGEGTRSYKSYDRTWILHAPGKQAVACSNDPLLGGDPLKYNPEDMLLSALSACHMLWYLHLAAIAGIVVHAYGDDPIAIGETLPGGAGRFLRAELRPTITVDAATDLARADAIHREIHAFCFIARSVNFPVEYSATYTLSDESAA